MSAAWRLNMPATKKLTLLALCDWANDEGGSLYPSISAIAARCSVSERTAQRLVHGLIEDDWLKVVGNENGGRPGMSRRYQINAERIYSEGAITGVNSSPVTGDSLTPLRVTNEARRVTNQVETGDTGVTRSTIDPSVKASTRKKGAPAARAAPVKTLDRPNGVSEQTWSDWLALRKAKRAPVTEAVLRHAEREAAKAGMTLEAFLVVWCYRGSQGLEASWLTPTERGEQERQLGVAGRITALNRAQAFRGEDDMQIGIIPLPEIRGAARAPLEGEFEVLT